MPAAGPGLRVMELRELVVGNRTISSKQSCRKPCSLLLQPSRMLSWWKALWFNNETIIEGRMRKYKQLAAHSQDAFVLSGSDIKASGADQGLSCCLPTRVGLENHPFPYSHDMGALVQGYGRAGHPEPQFQPFTRVGQGKQVFLPQKPCLEPFGPVGRQR